MKKINVLQVCNELGLGGTEKAMQIFSETLDKNIFDVKVCGISKGGAREGLLIDKDFKPFIASGNYKKFFNYVRENRIDIMHIHRGGTNDGLVIQTAKQAGVPIIVETNVFGLFDKKNTEKIIDSHLLVSKTNMLKYVKNANIDINKFLNRGKVIYNPVCLESFRANIPSQLEIQRLKSALNIEKDTPLICRVGRADISKWSRFTLNMLSYLTKEIPNVRLLVIGGIDPVVKRAFNKKGLTDFVIDYGVSTDEKIIQFYYSIDLLAHSSRIGESFGYTIAEAMAAGKPVVVNSTPWEDNAQIELVDHGVTGFIANTPRTYADAVAYLINNKTMAKKMGAAGQEKIERYCNSNIVTCMLQKIYIDLLNWKKIPIDQTILDYYKGVDIVPTVQDIIHYPDEYKKRLRRYYGKPGLNESLDFKMKNSIKLYGKWKDSFYSIRSLLK